MKELRQEGKIGQIPDYSPIMKPEFPNLFPFRLHGANLLHCRSPFLCASSTSNLGSLTHPAGDRPSHPNLIVISVKLPRIFYPRAVYCDDLAGRSGFPEALAFAINRFKCSLYAPSLGSSILIPTSTAF